MLNDDDQRFVDTYVGIVGPLRDEVDRLEERVNGLTIMLDQQRLSAMLAGENVAGLQEEEEGCDNVFGMKMCANGQQKPKEDHTGVERYRAQIDALQEEIKSMSLDSYVYRVQGAMLTLQHITDSIFREAEREGIDGDTLLKISKEYAAAMDAVPQGSPKLEGRNEYAVRRYDIVCALRYVMASMTENAFADGFSVEELMSRIEEHADKTGDAMLASNLNGIRTPH